MQEIISLENTHLEKATHDIAGQLSERSQRIYKNDIAHFVAWLDDKKIALKKITRSEYIDYRSHLSETYGVAAAERMFSVARRLLKELAQKGVVEKGITDDVRGFSVEQETTHTALTLSQAKQLLQAIDTTSIIGKRDFAIVMLLLRTGLRRFECVALNIGDLKNEQGHTIAIIRHGKGNKRNAVKVPVDVLRAIHAYIEASNRQNASPDASLFVGFDRGDKPTEKRLDTKTIERIVIRYGEKIGVPDLTPHGLRATFITLSLEGGAKLHQVQYAARHKDPRTTERYQTRKDNLDDNAVDYIKL